MSEATCLLCAKRYGREPGGEHVEVDFGVGSVDYGVCPQCRADAELGRLVRVMSRGSCLTNNLCSDREEWKSYNGRTDSYHWGATPEEALKGGK